MSDFLDDFRSSLHEFELLTSSEDITLENLASIRIPFSPVRNSSLQKSQKLTKRTLSLNHMSDSELYPSSNIIKEVYSSLEPVRTSCLSPVTSWDRIQSPVLSEEEDDEKYPSSLEQSRKKLFPESENLPTLLKSLKSCSFEDLPTLLPLINEKILETHDITSYEISIIFDCLSSTLSTITTTLSKTKQYNSDLISGISNFITNSIPIIFSIVDQNQSIKLISSFLTHLYDLLIIFPHPESEVCSLLIESFVAFKSIGLSFLLKACSSTKSLYLESSILNVISNNQSIIQSFLIPSLIEIINSSIHTIEIKTLSVVALGCIGIPNSGSNDVLNFLSNLLISKSCFISKKSIARSISALGSSGVEILIKYFEIYPYPIVMEACLIGLGSATSSSRDYFDLLVNITHDVSLSSLNHPSFGVAQNSKDRRRPIGNDETFTNFDLRKGQLSLSYSVKSFSTHIRKLSTSDSHWVTSSLTEELNHDQSNLIVNVFFKGFSSEHDKVVLAALTGFTDFLDKNPDSISQINSPVKYFSALSRHSNPQIRSCLADCLSRLGHFFPNDSCCALLQNLLSDSFFKVRKSAIEACTLLGSHISPLFSKLVTLLEDSSSPKQIVCHALLAVNASQGVNLMLERLANGVSRIFSVQSLIIFSEVLYDYSLEEPNFIEDFIKILNTCCSSPKGQLRLFSFKLLLRYRNIYLKESGRDILFILVESEDVLPTLLQTVVLLPLCYKFLKDPVQELRDISAEVLVNAGPQGRLLLVEGALRDQSPVCRATAVSALSAFGTVSLRLFLLALSDPHLSVYKSALEGISSLEVSSMVSFVLQLPSDQAEAIVSSINRLLESDVELPLELQKSLRIVARSGSDFVIDCKYRRCSTDSPFLL
ncbi:hypothetical protein RCL1_000430 [Eukaryota sp. TZLM3-RCL]